MNELIKIQPQTINGNAVETVSARELHTFVESKRQFADWIKNRIEKYGFVENQDFIKVVENHASQKNVAEKSMTYDNWQIGLKTVLRSMSLLRTTTMLVFR